MTQVILIDGKNAVFRHNHVHSHLSRQDGKPTGAIYGCLTSMLGLHRILPEAAIVWCWDGRGDTWRHKFMQTFPQLDNTQFPEISEDDGLENYSQVMAQNSLEFLGLSKPVKEVKEKKRGYKADRNHPEEKKKKGKQPEYPETPRER